MIHICFNFLAMEWKFFSNGMFPQVPFRKPSALLTISGDKHWDVLLVVLVIRLWGRLDILWKMKGQHCHQDAPQRISVLIDTAYSLLKGRLCLFSPLSVHSPKSLRFHAEPGDISGVTLWCVKCTTATGGDLLFCSGLLQKFACSAAEWIDLGHLCEIPCLYTLASLY